MYIHSSFQEGAQLYIKKDDAEFLVASLTKERPQATINLFICLLDNITLLVKGSGSIHVAGFNEPEPEGGLPFDGEEDEEDDEEDLELEDDEDDE